MTKTALEHHAGVNRPPLLLDPSETEKTLVSVPIDPAGKLPDGRTFEGIDDFKKLLLEDKEAFLQCLTEKMLVYALGRPVLFGDRILVRNIVGDLKKQPTMDTLIKAIVTSDAFHNKDQGRKMIKPISRRTVLRGTGAAIALPMLEIMTPRLRADESLDKVARMVCVIRRMVTRNSTWYPEKQDSATPCHQL